MQAVETVLYLQMQNFRCKSAFGLSLMVFFLFWLLFRGTWIQMSAMKKKKKEQIIIVTPVLRLHD